MSPQKRTRDGRPVLRTDSDKLQMVITSLQAMIITINTFANLKIPASLLRRLQLPATKFTTLEEAADAVQVTYNRNSPKHLWEPKSSELSDGRLSEWADTGIDKILMSPYFRLANSETNCRTILDIIFCDRLEQLEDSKSEHCLNWFPKMTLSVKSEPLNKLIQGRAGNCLAYGKQKSDLHTALIVLEAKNPGLVSIALPQLIVYLAAVQDSRKESTKINSCVFGLITDSDKYEFAYLDEDRNLFVSNTYKWASQKLHIIQLVDKVLKDSIEATPHTTPVKTGNKTIHNYRTYLNDSHRVGTFEVVDNSDMRRWKVVKKTPFGEVLMELE
ncbi:uncharacterized protein TRUGW13939_04544 [Talaromyces rugulosus]|uniref:Uncharacterized protein n=1 Tax=Talaromyces rugulosus TaxID=121627 RepID=A0A7H8QTW8_TALRU|nr:uncharacterized protein TRUGW13939_04544 [Talaromyces rugulosus]QKX57432.1 hypothetical protein TRUGW13939_04544 [Talaromyces rugulosus]